MFAQLDKANRLSDPALGPFLNYRAGQPISIRLDDAIRSNVVTVASTATWPPFRPARVLGFADHFSQVLMGRDLILMKENNQSLAEARERYTFWFKLFIILTQIQIALFFTFMVWLLFKIVFWLGQVYRMLPTGEEGGERVGSELEFKPILSDPAERYGLGALFRPYNLLVLVVAIGSSFSALHFPEGAGFSAINNADGAGMGATRVEHLVAVSAAILGVLIGPLWLYPRRLMKWAEATRLQRLRHELLKSEKDKHRKALLEEENTINSQSTWPHGDKRFRLTIAIVFAVLLLPVGTAFQFLPGEITPLTRLPQVLRTACKDFAANLYGIKKFENNE